MALVTMPVDEAAVNMRAIEMSRKVKSAFQSEHKIITLTHLLANLLQTQPT
jgi:hypothetical protein